MKIGIPKEIKDSEHRVGMTPSGVQTLVENKHDVFVQSGALDLEADFQMMITKSLGLKF